jgi:hypothetical protein
MESKVRQLVDKIQRLNMSHDQVTGIRGTTNKESVTLDLYRSASLLMNALNSKDDLLQKADELEGKLKIAQVLNAIGQKDLDELIAELDEIREIA